MWHASVSLQNRKGKIDDAATCERAAIQALDGVGGEHEWWLWSPALVGHLRVPVTDAEYLLVPPGRTVDDAGETGPERRRSYLT